MWEPVIPRAHSEPSLTLQAGNHISHDENYSPTCSSDNAISLVNKVLGTGNTENSNASDIHHHQRFSRRVHGQ